MYTACFTLHPQLFPKILLNIPLVILQTHSAYTSRRMSFSFGSSMLPLVHLALSTLLYERSFVGKGIPLPEEPPRGLYRAMNHADPYSLAFR